MESGASYHLSPPIFSMVFTNVQADCHPLDIFCHFIFNSSYRPPSLCLLVRLTHFIVLARIFCNEACFNLQSVSVKWEWSECKNCDEFWLPTMNLWIVVIFLNMVICFYLICINICEICIHIFEWKIKRMISRLTIKLFVCLFVCLGVCDITCKDINGGLSGSLYSLSHVLFYMCLYRWHFNG